MVIKCRTPCPRGSDLSPCHILSAAQTHPSLPLQRLLAPPERTSCLQVAPLSRSLRSVVLQFLSVLSHLFTAHTWSKFLWPSTTCDLSLSWHPHGCPGWLPLFIYTLFLPLWFSSCCFFSQKYPLSTKILYYSVQMLFPPYSLLLPLQETVPQCLNTSDVLLRMPLSNALLLG